MSIKERIHQSDVTIMNSYLEVDVAQWFSENKIPYAYEPFVIPSVEEISGEKYDKMLKAIRQSVDQLTPGETYKIPNYGLTYKDQHTDVIDLLAISNIWTEIYEKHRLQQPDDVSVPPQQALRKFGKDFILPDFTTYQSLEGDFKKKGDGVIAPEGFDYGNFDNIVEVSGLYGVGIPEDKQEEEGEKAWWDWYRASGVAMKELIYKLLGLWEVTYFLIPMGDTSTEEGEAPLPKSLLNDPHYIEVPTSQGTLRFPELKNRLGITKETVNDTGRLSNRIDLIQYDRDHSSSKEEQSITRRYFKYEGVDESKLGKSSNVYDIEGDWIVYYGELGEVYIQTDGGGVHVRESMWRNTSMMILREYVVNIMSKLSNLGIVEGFHEV